MSAAPTIVIAEEAGLCDETLETIYRLARSCASSSRWVARVALDPVALRRALDECVRCRLAMSHILRDLGFTPAEAVRVGDEMFDVYEDDA